MFLVLFQFENLHQTSNNSSSCVGEGYAWPTLAGLHVDAIIHLRKWLTGWQRMLLVSIYLICSHVDYVDLVDPLPDSVGLLTVLLVVEQPGQLVAKLEHLHILNSLFSTVRLKYKSSPNPTLTACTNLVKPDPSPTHLCIPPLPPHPVKYLVSKGEELPPPGDLIYPGIGQPIPGHVIKWWLRTIGKQQLLKTPGWVDNCWGVSAQKQDFGYPSLHYPYLVLFR